MDDFFLDATKTAPNPCYILDERKFIQNMETLSAVQKLSGAKILCAFKGFSMWSTFPIMKKHLAGATASSLNEVRLCFEEMGVKAHSCFVVYLEEEFETVLQMSSHVTFNSLNQYDTFKKYIKDHPEVSFALRLNPKFSKVTTAKYNPCMPGSRFGISMEDMPNNLPVGITGLHFHSLCESDADELEQVLGIIESKIGNLLHQCNWVNMGGGHHLTRKDYNKDLLVTLLNNFKQKYSTEMFLEPGEAIGWETGVLLSKVQDVVESDGVKTAILNVSFSAHMPDCLEMPYKPRVVNEKPQGKSYVLGGNSCMSGDFVSGFHFENELQVGDEVIFEDMMHYTFVKSSTFNGVALPGIATVKTSGELIVQKEFSYSDFKSRLS
ncbi:MAG: carboxynorspermidine decarboxylase [Saprospiraceae bacterium]|jgi:carboxynorspermidine decarboxylase